jgi:hypothetical protein
MQRLQPAEMNASDRTECLDGTRKDLLEFIKNWVAGSSSGQNILWLHGVAGSGKSTLTNHFRDSSMGAFIFFDQDVTSRNDPTSVIRTITYQLALHYPDVGLAIAKAINKTPTIFQSPIALQFQRLLLEPLPILLVLEA